MGNKLKEKVCLRSREDGEQTQGPDRDKEMLGEQLPQHCKGPAFPLLRSEGAETVPQQ